MSIFSPAACFERRQGDTIPQNGHESLRKPTRLRQSIEEMQRLAPWVALLLVGTGVASAQSLAEVAKKEKDRRARTASTVPPDEPAGHDSVPVIGNVELAEAQGDGLSVTGSTEKDNAPSEAEPSPADAGDASDSAGPTEHRLTQAEIRDYRETWARIWPERLEAAEKELELARDAVYQCQSAAHYVFVPLAIDCNGVFKRRAIAEYRLRETRRNRYNWELLLPERQRPPPRQ